MDKVRRGICVIRNQWGRRCGSGYFARGKGDGIMEGSNLGGGGAVSERMCLERDTVRDGRFRFEGR